MALLERYDQQIGFVREIISPLKVAFIQRPSRLFQEGFGLVEDAALGFGEGCTFKLGDTPRQVFLSGLDPPASIRAARGVGRLERRRFDRRLAKRWLRRSRLSRRSAPPWLL
jgi:hypothetical protein